MQDRGRVVERRPTGSATALFAVLSFTAIAVFQSLAVLRLGGLPERTLPMLGETGVEILAVIVIVVAAYRMKTRNSRITWALIGLAVLGATLGDVVWTKDLLLTGQDTLSGAGMALYAIEYVAIPLACAVYVNARRDLLELARPTTEAVTVAAIGTFVLWFAVIGPVMGRVASASDAMPTALYAFADYPLLVVPTLIVLLAVARVERRGLLAPWLLFAIGVGFVIAADAGWFYQRSLGLWQSGSLVDFAFMGGHVLMATAALSFLENERWLASEVRD